MSQPTDSRIDPQAEFQRENAESIRRLAESEDVKAKTAAWIDLAGRYRYTYLFSALGRPIKIGRAHV